MGQKVHPVAFRLNVPHRGTMSLMFRPKAMESRLVKGELNQRMPSNPTGSPDRRGWSHQVDGIFRGSGDDYGQKAMLGVQMEKEMAERMALHKLVMNRWTTHDHGDWREGRIEFMPLSGRTRSPEAQGRWNLSLARRENKMREKTGTRVRLSSLNLLDRVRHSDEWQTDMHQFREKTNLIKEHEKSMRDGKLTGVKEKTSGFQSRVQMSVMRKALRRAGVRPVSPRISRLRVIRREDHPSQRKILSEVRKRRELISTSKNFGLVHHSYYEGMGIQSGTLTGIQTRTQGSQVTSGEKTQTPDKQGITDVARSEKPQAKNSTAGSTPDVTSQMASESKASGSTGGYRGVRRRVKGTLDGSRRTRKEVIQLGVLPLSTLSSPRSYSREQAKTKVGSMGVQVIYIY